MPKTKLNTKVNVLQGGNHYISCDYGYTYSNGGFHKGIDLLASDISGKGADYICAFADGTVTSYCNSMSGTTDETGTAGMGNYVIIDHGNGYKTRYMHMLKGSVKVKTGEKVKKGQVIGYMGNTGNSTGRHLHFDISYKEKLNNSYASGGRYYVDPKPFLKGEKTLSKVQDEGTEKYVNVKTYLNVRKGAGVNYAIAKKLAPGTKVHVYETKDGWSRIGTGLWVMSIYLA